MTVRSVPVPSVPVPTVPAPMRAAILAWFEAEGRPLAFRSTTDPWAILVAEAMAQQTQAARAAAAWVGFLARFPTPGALAAARPADVLRAWRGLGYNRRALSLRRAAIVIVDEHGGRVPDDLEALGRLPGVGPYTARAVAALAFGQPVGAVDTNVRRVLSRAVGGRVDAYGSARLQAVADASVPAGRPGYWTHALMDVGATFCRSRAPRCDACPARAWCRAAADGTAETAVGGISSRDRGPRRSPAFPATGRWLRGRLLDRLRDAADEAWVALPEVVGEHDRAAVATAVAALVVDGLAERHPERPDLLRLPIT